MVRDADATGVCTLIGIYHVLVDRAPAYAISATLQNLYLRNIIDIGYGIGPVLSRLLIVTLPENWWEVSLQEIMACEAEF